MAPLSAVIAVTLPHYDHKLQYLIRREQDRLVIELQFDYKDEEVRYILSQLLSGKRLAKWEKQGLPIFPRTDSERQAAVAHFLEQLEQYAPPEAVWRRGHPAQVRHWPDEVTEIIISAFRTFGFDAVRLDVADEMVVRQQDTRAKTFGYLTSLDRLGAIIGAIIRDWQRRVREERDPHKRRHVLENLRRVGKALIPPTKGKRIHRVGVPAREVQKHYYKELFRYEQASALLKQTTPFSRRWQTRLLAVCQVLDLHRAPSWWGFNEEQQVWRQLLRAKETAVLLTARHFNMSERTISNILAG